MKENNRKNVIWNIVGATVSAFNSLLFTIIATRINGTSDAGIFAFAFAFSCWFYVIGVYSGRVFQVTDRTGKNSDTDYIYNRIFTCILMMLSVIVFCFIKGYDSYKVSIIVSLCLFKCVEAFSECIYAIIQKNGQLYKVGISLFIKAIIGIITFFIVDYITKNMLLSCISVIIVNIVILIIYDFLNMKKVEVIKTKYNNESNLRILKTGIFAFALNFISIYLINAPRYAIDDLLPNDMQTIFGIIIMPATFMGLLGQYIIQPSVTKISKFIKDEEYENLRKMIINLILIVIGTGIAVLVIAYFLEVPVLQLVYGIELVNYFDSMMIIIIGSIFYSIGVVISAILISMRRTLSQVIVYGLTSIIATFLAYRLVNITKIQGASITYLVTMLVVAIVFIGLVFNCVLKYKKEWEKNK